MKLEEILESRTSMQPVDQYEPSGAGSAVSVDPDKVDDMLDPKGNRFSKKDDLKQADRSKIIRRKIQIAKASKAPPRQTGKVVDDSQDMTGSGPNSAVNGPVKY